MSASAPSPSPPPTAGSQTLPRSASDRAWLLGLLLLAALGFGWFYYGRGLEVPDEGLLLHAAERLAAGEVPYRDVYFIYTPGLQYLLAGLFRLFGPSLAVEHGLLAVLHLGLVAIVYTLAARLTRWVPLAILAALVVILVGLNSYRFLLGLLAVGALTRFAATGRGGWLLAVGLLVGVTYVFAQEVGLYALGTALGFIGLDWLTGGRRALGRPLRQAGLVVGGAALVVVPWLLVLVAQEALAPMIDATVRVAFLHQPRYMHVPLPPLWPIIPPDLDTNVVWGPPPYLFYVKLLLYLPLVCVAVGWVVVGGDLRQARLARPTDSARRPARRVAWPLLLFATLALATVADRADYYHLRQVLPVTLVLLAWLLARGRERLGGGRLPSALALAPFLPLVAVSLAEASAFRAEQSVLLQTPRGSVLVDETKARDLDALLAALAERTVPGEAIVVWPAETAVYFLANRRNPTRYGQLVPTELELLAEDAAREQRAMVAAVDGAGVRWGVAAPTENVNGLPFAAYAPLLSDYLEARFPRAERFGYWMLRGPADAGPSAAP